MIYRDGFTVEECPRDSSHFSDPSEEDAKDDIIYEMKERNWGREVYHSRGIRADSRQPDGPHHAGVHHCQHDAKRDIGGFRRSIICSHVGHPRIAHDRRKEACDDPARQDVCDPSGQQAPPTSLQARNGHSQGVEMRH